MSDSVIIAIRPPENDVASPVSTLLGLAQRLELDAVRVLVRIAERLVAGRGTYGELVLATDRRDFTIEASEEVLDACVYLAARLLKDGAP